jgi:PAS domain S-box-containing protein
MIALVIQSLLWPVLAPFAWFVPLSVVLLASWFGGSSGGIGATLVSAVLVWWRFLSPEGSLLQKDPSAFLSATIFVGLGLTLSAFMERLKTTTQKLAAANDEISRLYQDVKQLDELKTQFFANVSHELRTPLALILGPTERLLAAATLSETERNDLGVIARNGRALLKQVNALLDLAKLDAGKMRLDYAEVDLARLLALEASQFEVLAQDKLIAFGVEGESTLFVQVDPEKVAHVVSNILSNAFKFTPDRGKVRCSLRLEKGSQQATLEVADSGPGIPPEDREAVFERFRQLEGGVTRRFGGSGLGLAIAHDFIHLHGGTIRIAQAPEGGALFTVNIPLKAPPVAAVGPAEHPSAVAEEVARLAVQELRPSDKTVGPSNPPLTGGLPSVLVVEDNREMNRFICASLSGTYRTISAFDGEEGLAKATERTPDLVLSDVMMPKMSGDELVHALRQSPRFALTPIVMLTAKADDASRVTLLRGGVQDYLTKPFSVEELRARVSNLIARKQAEELVRQAEAKFRGIVSMAADAIISIDEEQRVVLYNEGAQAIFGWSPEEVLGKGIEMLLPERFRTLHGEQVRRFAARDMKARRLDERTGIFGLRKSGEEFPAQAAISKLELDGHWIFTVVVRDISESKRMEDEQRLLSKVGAAMVETLDYQEIADALARTIVESFADWCFVVVKDEEQHRVRRLAVATSEPAKMEVAQALKQFHLDVNRPYLGHDVLASGQPQIKTDVAADWLQSIAQDEEHRRLLEAVAPVSLMGIPLFAYGRFLGAVTFVSSRKERRYTASDLPLAEALAHRAGLAIENARLYEVARHAIQARDDMLGIVAHDLRNPLGGILMAAGRLHRAGQEPERRSQKPGETIQRAAKRMNRLIQDLLDVTRMEAGRFSVERSGVPVQQVLKDSFEAQKALVSAADIELRLEVACDLPVILADRDRLLQVFENLVGNSIKFTAKGGRITVGASPKEGAVLFWVRDTGSGIAAENLPHVFDRFWQGEKGAHRGAGLGLAIVHGIIEAHGGRVWVESVVGQGTTIYFAIPERTAAEVAVETPSRFRDLRQQAN